MENILKGHLKNQQQMNLITPLLKDLLNPHEPLFQLSDRIDWIYFEKEFGKLYIDFGRPAKPIRLMVSLLILKQLYSLSDEELVEVWRQNPYYQYFSGMDIFQWGFPCVANELTHFRKRIGRNGAEKILQHSIALHGTSACEKEVIIDSTVMEKNITFPTDVKLHKKIIERCQQVARRERLELRQSYRYTLRRLLLDQRFSRHPRNRKRARASARKIKTIAGRLIRELERELPVDGLARHQDFIDRSKRILSQSRCDRNKLYSLHEPDVYCISKGKEHKPYEFGTKVSIVKTKKSGIIIGALNIHNHYDGHTLPEVLEQSKRLTDHCPNLAIVDRGYRGVTRIGNTRILSPKKLRANASPYERQKIRNRFRKRAGIEPIIGHLKSDHRMLRNYLKGTEGDDMNILLAAAAFNYKKLLNQWRFIFGLIFRAFNKLISRSYLLKCSITSMCSECCDSI